MPASRLRVGSQQPQAKQVVLTTNQNASMRGRVKTEADSAGFDWAPPRSSFNRYERQSSKQHTGSASSEKERLNDAIVKRCKLTLAPH